MSLHIECTVQTLLKAAQAILPAVSGRSTLPILSHALIEASEDGIRMMGTDLEMGIRVSAQATVKQAGQATAEVKMLTALLSKLPASAMMELSATDTGNLKLSCLKSVYALNGADPEGFPLWRVNKEDEPVVCFEAEGTVLLTAIEQTLYAVSTDATRAIICGVYLKTDGETLTMVGTDTHRLAVKTASLRSGTGARTLILPAPFLSILKPYLEKEEAPTFQMTPRCIWVSLPGYSIEIFSKVIEGQYPNYQRVVPAHHESMITFDREEMRAAVSRVMLVAEDDANRVVFSPAGMFLELSAHSGGGQAAREEVGYSAEGEPPTIAFNGKYFLSALATLQGANAQLEFGNTPLKPGVLYDMAGEDRDPSLLVVLMPMQIIGGS